MSSSIKNISGSNVAEVDNGKSLLVSLRDLIGNRIGRKHREKIEDTSEAIMIAGKNDDFATFLRTDRKGNQMIGNHTIELEDRYEGATVNARKWALNANVWTNFSQSTVGGITTVSTTAVGSSLINSIRFFEKIQRRPLQIKFRLRHSMVANSVLERGFGVGAIGSSLTPNGVFFRMTSSGIIEGVVTANTTQVAIANIIAKVTYGGNIIDTPLNMSSAEFTSSYFVYDVIIDDDNAIFTIQNTETGEMVGMLNLPMSKAIYKAWGATALPSFIRLYNTAISSSAPIVYESEMIVVSTDWGRSLSASESAANMCTDGFTSPLSGGQLAQYANSTQPASMALANATCVNATTLKDGKFQFAAVAGAETDYIVFGYQVPANTRFIIQGIKILELQNTGAAVATTAHVFEWFLAYGGTAVSLATAGIIRVPIGRQMLPIGAYIDAITSHVEIKFETPIAVETGQFIRICLRMPRATATASQIIRGECVVMGRTI